MADSDNIPNWDAMTPEQQQQAQQQMAIQRALNSLKDQANAAPQPSNAPTQAQPMPAQQPQAPQQPTEQAPQAGQSMMDAINAKKQREQNLINSLFNNQNNGK